MGSKDVVRICPRCGGAYSYIEERKKGEQVYYLAVHVRYEKTDGGYKRHVKKCYLGPDLYKYVSKLHEREDLAFAGLVDQDRLVDYLDTIYENVMNSDSLSYLGLLNEKGNPKIDEVEKLIKKLEDMINKIRQDLSKHQSEVKPTEEWEKAQKSK